MRKGLLEISPEKNEASLAAIKILINRHQRIIDLSDNIEDLFSNIALLQFIWNTLVICCIGFLIVIVSHNFAAYVQLTRFCNAMIKKNLHTDMYVF